jgi:hypothetical protein
LCGAWLSLSLLLSLLLWGDRMASAEQRPASAAAAPAAPAASAGATAKDGAVKKAAAAAPADSRSADAATPVQRPKPRPVLDPQRVVPATWTGTSTGGAAATDGGREARPAGTPAAEPTVARRVGAVAGTGKARLPLAPSAAEIERERAEHKTDRDPAATNPPPASTGDRLQQRATATPSQDRRWPTSSPNTQGAGGSLGPRTMADRKGALQDASGPQQGVIRNRW